MEGPNPANLAVRGSVFCSDRTVTARCDKKVFLTNTKPQGEGLPLLAKTACKERPTYKVTRKACFVKYFLLLGGCHALKVSNPLLFLYYRVEYRNYEFCSNTDRWQAVQGRSRRVSHYREAPWRT